MLSFFLLRTVFSIDFVYLFSQSISSLSAFVFLFLMPVNKIDQKQREIRYYSNSVLSYASSSGVTARKKEREIERNSSNEIIPTSKTKISLPLPSPPAPIFSFVIFVSLCSLPVLFVRSCSFFSVSIRSSLDIFLLDFILECLSLRIRFSSYP